MSDTLLSVGIDVGTTTSQMVLSRLKIENQASSFQIPEMAISTREVLFRGPVHPTPLLDARHVDTPALRVLLEQDYRAAGIVREQVDTGAIIITGETSRKENARAVLSALSGLAGEFVVATAGPELESKLAAKGAGAPELSRETGQPLLHIDIGGGTSNYAWLLDGNIVKTGCMNVGGHLAVFDERGYVTALSPILEGLCSWQVGDPVTEDMAMSLARKLTEALEAAAGLRAPTALFEQLKTRESPQPDWEPAEPNCIVSFSGGVADCIENGHPWLAFRDLGPVLGRAIRESRLCRGAYRLGAETIRATVIGAGCHSAQLSGSTIFQQGVTLPLKNLPVLPLLPGRGEGLEIPEQTPVYDLSGCPVSGYAQLAELAGHIARHCRSRPLMLCMEQDMARALGQLLALQLGANTGILCLDRVRIPQDSYLDIGAPVGPALPVVVKTLILGSGSTQAQR